MALFPLPGISQGRSPQARLIFYIVLFAVVILIMVRAQEALNAEPQIPPPERQAYETADPVQGQPDPLARLEEQPRFLGQIVEADLSGAHAEGAAVDASDLARNDEAIRLSLGYLKGLSAGAMQEEAARHSHFTYARLLQEPERWRGRILHFYGVVLQIDTVEIPTLPPGLRKLFRVTCQDARKQEFFTVLTPQVARGLRKNMHFAADAVFLKRYAFRFQTEGKPAFWNWTPLLVSLRAYSHWEPTPPPELLYDPEVDPNRFDATAERLDPAKLEVVAEASKSGEEDASLHHYRNLFQSDPELQNLQVVRLHDLAADLAEEAGAYEHLLAYVGHFTPEVLAETVDPRINFEELMAGDTAPEWAQYKIAAVEGTALSAQRFDLPPPAPGSPESRLAHFYVLTVADSYFGNFDYKWSLLLADLPPGLRAGDHVRAEGVFVKFYPYVSRRNERQWTPLVVSPRLAILPPVSQAPSAGLLAGVTAAILLLGYALYRRNRLDDERRARIRRSLLERRSARDAIRAVKKRKQADGDGTPARGKQPAFIGKRSMRSELTCRERVARALARQPVDHVPVSDSLWDSTKKRWRAEGHLGPEEDFIPHFGIDLRSGGWINPVANLDFEPEILEESEETVLTRDGNYALLRRHKLHESTPEHVDFAVKDRAGWEELIRPHLLGLDRRRIPFESYGRERALAAREERFFSWAGVAPFEQIHPVCGHEHMLAGMALDPEWVREMALTYADLTIRHQELLFAEQGKPDGIWYYEDMGFKERPFMSPEMYRDLIAPAHRKLFDYAHGIGCKVIVHSCGFVEPLVPYLVEAGMDCLQSMEVKAGMDMRRLKDPFGDRIAFFGNIDVRVLIANDRKAIDEELEAKMVPMLSSGCGYLLHSDHSIPPEVDYETLLYFFGKGREISRRFAP